MLLEVVLSNRSELLVCMVKAGILRVIGDIIVSETDALVLVCLVFIFCVTSFLFLVC